jgi:hypothetical protein
VKQDKKQGIEIKSRRGQEEIAGFVVIIVIVAIILLVLLSLLLRTPAKGAAESYEIESFLGVSLQYTTSCEDYTGFLSLRELIILCEEHENCINADSCELLNITANELIANSWNVNEQSAIKGYEFSILTDGEEKILVEKGNKTGVYKGDFTEFARSGTVYTARLKLYE